MNYENVKDALKELVALNNPNTTFGKVSTIIDSGAKTGERKFELKDLQESNYELLANVCDLLGMSEIYLDDWKIEKDGKKSKRKKPKQSLDFRVTRNRSNVISFDFGCEGWGSRWHFILKVKCHCAHSLHIVKWFINLSC